MRSIVFELRIRTVLVYIVKKGLYTWSIYILIPPVKHFYSFEHQGISRIQDDRLCYSFFIKKTNRPWPVLMAERYRHRNFTGFAVFMWPQHVSCFIHADETVGIK